MATWTLPAELDDIIIDHLHDDSLTLSQCALVRRSWLPAARYHFWNHLRLNCSLDELNRLSTLISSSPDVRHYVRTVVVMQKKGEACQWYDLGLLYHTLSIISQLPNLTTLTLDGLWFGASKRGELEVSSVSSPSVRKLCISTCSFDTFEDVRRLCRSFPGLSAVQFDGLWWGRWIADEVDEEDLEEYSDPTRLSLRELDLGSCFSRDTVIDWLLDTSFGNTIETLRLPLIGAYDTRLKDLLAFVGTSLRHLEIGSPSTSHSRVRQNGIGAERTLQSYIDLSKNSELRTITLGVPTYRDSDFISSWLAAILDQLASPVLEEIRFAVYPILRGDAADAEAMLETFRWAELARMLEGPRFSMVKKVTFSSGRSTDYMQIPGAFVHLSPLLEKVIPGHFGSLRDKGFELSFKCV